MKKEMFSYVFLLSLFLVSFVAAEQYTSTTSVVFNSGDAAAEYVDSNVDYVSNSGLSVMWKDVIGVVSLVLIVLVIIMLHNLRKRKAKKVKAVKKKVAKKVSKKKVAKKRRK